MRANFLYFCKTAVPLSLIISIPFCEAHPGHHKHKHNERLPREERPALAGSDSSLIVNFKEGICSEHTT